MFMFKHGRKVVAEVEYETSLSYFSFQFSCSCASQDLHGIADLLFVLYWWFDKKS